MVNNVRLLMVSVIVSYSYCAEDRQINITSTPQLQIAVSIKSTEPIAHKSESSSTRPNNKAISFYDQKCHCCFFGRHSCFCFCLCRYQQKPEATLATSE